MQNRAILSEKQERFCLLWAVPDANGRTTSKIDAYLAAYPRCNSRRSAKTQVGRLLQNPQVVARIETLRAEVKERWLQERLPYARVVGILRKRIENGRLPHLQLMACRLALELQGFLPPRRGHLSEFAHVTDEELLLTLAENNLGGVAQG